MTNRINTTEQKSYLSLFCFFKCVFPFLIFETIRCVLPIKNKTSLWKCYTRKLPLDRCITDDRVSALHTSTEQNYLEQLWQDNTARNNYFGHVNHFIEILDLSSSYGLKLQQQKNLKGDQFLFARDHRVISNQATLKKA